MNNSLVSAPAPMRAALSSSPGRVETAPGLARLLKGKSGSRSRGKSSNARSSPMFISKSRSIGPSSSEKAAAENSEPSSPKVTCMGQVRIRNKKNKSKPSISTKSMVNPQHRPISRCRCVDGSFLCKIFTRRTSAVGRRRSLWRRLTLSLRSEGKQSYPPPGSAARGFDDSDLDHEPEERKSEDEEETRVFMPPPPPKNALLLMRCRSAPHNRSSFLATRSAASPIPQTVEASAIEALEKLGFLENDSSESSKGDCNIGEVESFLSSSPSAFQRIILTRSRSEPAKSAEPDATAAITNGVSN